ncbi:hypothetical protein [Mucilaginibacter sp. KACC 22063]|uniref:hypothetical protein n=1 Tax=Mucilaginibacter sp. KACC 22063 TaxID=3025666 RepID=UPI0023671BB3|nr:hypothetical protein [Mucilaginibacter sp. KACC 22063]WDF57198.1 hypothetical protein PQ461_09040 [Mucilaginibacter sp. KACC 22063]
MKKPLADILYISTTCLLLLISCGKREYKGYIYDNEKHVPLKGVIVKYHGQQVKSDKNGYFVVEDNDAVSDDITFSKNGYIPDTSETIIIHSGEQMTERFRNGHDTIFLLPIPKVQLQNNERDLSKSATIKWPITSQQFQKFYKKNPQTREYTLVVPSGYDLKIYADTGTHFQESPFGYEIKPGGRYLTAARFQLSGTDCKIIVYNVTGENDSPVLNIQLNSYNKEGQLQDALLLDSRFIFEVEYYRDFRIEETGIIKLKLHQIEHYTYNEQGDITGYIKDPQVESSSVTYQLQADRKFRKVDRLND